MFQERLVANLTESVVLVKGVLFGLVSVSVALVRFVLFLVFNFVS